MLVGRFGVIILRQGLSPTLVSKSARRRNAGDPRRYLLDCFIGTAIAGRRADVYSCPALGPVAEHFLPFGAMWSIDRVSRKQLALFEPVLLVQAR